MLQIHEARRIAHDRMKDLVTEAQSLSGLLNPNPSGELVAEDPTTESKIVSLEAAFRLAREGLEMLMEAERGGLELVSVVGGATTARPPTMM